MPTAKQKVGDVGERHVARHMPCLKCKRSGSMKQLPPNFKCADLICDFCGATSQVKTFRKDNEGLPPSILGAAWQPQSERMQNGIYHALWLVRLSANMRVKEVWLLPSELQNENLFQKRQPLSANAKRADWQGYLIDAKGFADRIIKMQ